MTNEEESKRIGRQIAALRKTVKWTDEMGIHRTKMSQEQLAQRAGIQRTHLLRIEQGMYDIRLSVLSSIAEALGCTIELVENNE